MTTPDLPEMDIVPAKRSPLRNLSFVWLVPILALILAVGVALQSYSNKGTLIKITFRDAAGITAKDTTIRYRDVIIGEVEDVEFTKDMTHVEIFARVKKEVADTLSPDTLFWVVRPEVSTRGVTGLSTVLSGVYLDAAWNPITDSEAREFIGLNEAPLIRPGHEGTRISIRSRNGSSLTAGAPVFFRGMEVGRLDIPRLSDSGDSTDVDAFINAPYDKFLNTNSRFWNKSGFSVSLGPQGLNLDVASLGSLLVGGVAFENVVSGGEPVSDDTIFRLFKDEAAARDSVFTQLGASSITMAVVFSESINGLNSGAPVEYRGLRVGQVTSISAFVAKTDAGQTVKLRALLSIEPQSLGLPEDATPESTRSFIENLINDGMRARLATSSIFSSALKIELAQVEDAEPARLEDDSDGTPVIPSVKSELPDFTATAEGVLQRVNNLPIEEVMNQAIALMASFEALANDKGTKQVPEAILKLVDDARNLVGRDDTQALPGELRGVVTELGKTIETLETMLTELKGRGAVDQLSGVLTNIDKVMGDFANASGDITTAAGDLPALLEDLRAVAAKARALEVETLVASVTNVVNSANSLISQEDAQALPADLRSALRDMDKVVNDLGAVVVELRERGAMDNLLNSLANLEKVSTDAATASGAVPELVEDLRKLTARASELKAEELIASATRVVDSANALLDSDGTRSIPPALASALDEVGASLKELREGGAITNTNAALASARDAADAVADAARNFPDVSDQLDAIITKTNRLLTTYGDKSTFNNELLDLLREFKTTAKTVSQLARTIERNPNSLILGR